MAKRRFENTRLSLFPKPVVVVTSINNTGEIGVATIAWTGIVSSRPTVISVSFLPDSFTRSCIAESRDFAVNIPDETLWKEVNYVGSVSGKWDVKMQKLPDGLRQLSLNKSTLIRSPHIDEFYLNFECRVLNVVQIGLYDCILGEVLTMHCDEDAYLDNHRKGNINHKLYHPLFCLGDEYWSVNQSLGSSTENKDHPHGEEH